jgi:hypothetical protein
MVRATTPTFICTFPETVDLSVIANMYFTLKQGLITITKHSEDVVIDGNNVSVYFSQSDTLHLVKGPAEVQLNWTYDDGSRCCSEIITISVTDNLLKEVVV